ncbi:MAG: Gfo/Idh/MocA family oxidoreductase, partial [Microbacterium sp.]|nr:Gfo/Idh/MocA family oxidoreductase [Microbacterium sp.]
SSAYPAGAEWYGAEELSGGIILDQMIHDLDQARWLAGEVESVFAQATRRSQGDPVHAAHVLLRHTSGAISSCAGVWGPPHLEFTTGFSVAGSLGRLEYSSSRETELSFDLAPVATDGGHLPSLSAAVDPYALEVADFLRSLRTGSTPRVTAEDGHEAVRIAEAAVLSARTGQLVRVSETGVAR